MSASVSSPPVEKSVTFPAANLGQAAEKASTLDLDYATFLHQYGGFYQPKGAIDFEILRKEQYGRLDEEGQTYLDYVGASLHGSSQVNAHVAVLNHTVLGNPHSTNPASIAATKHEEECRAAIFSHFNADPNEYDIVFTPNASHAMKLVGESFPFTRSSRFLYTSDSHNSVVGLRQYAQCRRAKSICFPLAMPDLRLDTEKLAKELAKGRRGVPKLFALTGQSNTTGVRHPLYLIEKAQKQGWTVLLDAAALAPTGTVDLSKYKPDFVGISFYKMFGYPSGIGCLLARRSALAKLKRPWFSGGTVRLVSAFHRDINFMHDKETGAHFQDGTIPYSTLPGVTIGLKHLNGIGLENIGSRTRVLTKWLMEQMSALRHDNGEPLVKIYGPSGTDHRGATIALNLYDRNRRWIPHFIVGDVAARHEISIRTGCFCNPGVAEQVLGYSKFSEGPTLKFGAFYMWLANRVGVDRLLGGLRPFDNPFGMVRVSVGIASNFNDAWRWIELLKTSFLNPDVVMDLTSQYEKTYQPPTTLC
jgi:selenocysteine lyase/cysteine desulfurase